jgi:hypothetical protein
MSTVVAVRRWEAVFRVEGVRVVFTPAQSTSDPFSLAADLVSGICFGYQWWVAEYSRNTRLLPLQQVFFVCGRRHLQSVLSPRWNCPEAVLASGSIFGHLETRPAVRRRAGEIEKKLRRGQGRIVIGVLDRSLSTDGGSSNYRVESHASFYDRLFGVAEARPDLALVVKPKRAGSTGPAVFDHAPDLRARLERLEADGRAVLLDGSRSVAEAALASDVVVSLGYNSGGFLAALGGVRSVFWDPARLMRGPDPDWYRRIGWDRVAYEDMDVLLDELHRFVTTGGRDGSSESFGDLSGHLDEIAFFYDGLAGKRIGLFVSGLLEALDEGIDQHDAIARAATAYADRWGERSVFRSPRASSQVHV